MLHSSSSQEAPSETISAVNKSDPFHFLFLFALILLHLKPLRS